VRGQLVGRSRELQQLKQHWANAQQARGQLVLLSGEPGVGKTRLAQDLVAHARQSGATVLRGGCYEYEATTPYLPFVEAFREWTRRQSAAQLRAALGPTAPEIAKLAPEIEAKLGPLAANAPLSPSEERMRLFDNAARFLASLAAERGLLLFIDDVHWADQGTLSLLHYLLRHLRNDRALVLAAYREIELDRAHPLASALVEWNRERLVTRLVLGRLSHADTGALVATLFGMRSVSDEFVTALYRETEGNPFFIEEVIKSLIEQGQIYREEEGWGRKEMHELAIPQSVKEAIGRRLTRLGEAAADVLRTAAALGKNFSFRELAAVAEAGDDALLDALDEASAAQLIRANASGSGAAAGSDDSFAFTHDKIREVLYEEVNPIRRRRLHQRVGEAMEKLYGEAGAADRAQDLAHHFMQAGDLERSLTYSRRAAQNAERIFAHDEALKFLEQARESAEALHRTDDVPAIDEQIGDIHEMRGTTHPAVESFQRALAAATNVAARAALNAKIGKAYCAIGDARGLPYLEQALSELDPRTQANSLALATAQMGRYYHYRTEHNKAIEFLDRARQLAEPLDDPATLSDIYSFLAGAHQHLMNYDESNRWARVAIAMGERKKFPEAVASGYEFMSENAGGRGNWDDALTFAARDHDEGRKSGSLVRVAWSQFCTAWGQHGKGDLASARATALSALELCDQIGEFRLATWVGPMAATIAADQGDDDAARALAERGWARAQELNQLLLSAWALNGLGYAAMQRGDPGEALAWYEQYTPLIRDTENGVARLLILASAAEAFVRAGRLDDAWLLTAQAISVAEFAKAPHRFAHARRVQGQILLAQHDVDGALAAFDEAIATLTPLGSRLELARAMYHRAALLLARAEAKDQEPARAEAGRARDSFAAMGAVHDRVLADQLLGN
jgi:tetratricopeptide (TPR) repeat protein